MLDRNETDWNAYSRTYDLLLTHNPAYGDILQLFLEHLRERPPRGPVVDIGGGTGNYSLALLQTAPDTRLTFIEPDPGMMSVAEEKLRAFPNVTFDTRPFQAFESTPSFDLAIMVHSLYVMDDPGSALRRLHRILSADGCAFICDLGRILDVSDWRKYIFLSIVRRAGLRSALSVLWKGRSVAAQNWRISTAQRSGVYWTHSHQEMCSAARKAGLAIRQSREVYRGYSDLLIATPNGRPGA